MPVTGAIHAAVVSEVRPSAYFLRKSLLIAPLISIAVLSALLIGILGAQLLGGDLLPALGLVFLIPLLGYGYNVLLIPLLAGRVVVFKDGFADPTRLGPPERRLVRFDTIRRVSCPHEEWLVIETADRQIRVWIWAVGTRGFVSLAKGLEESAESNA